MNSWFTVSLLAVVFFVSSCHGHTFHMGRTCPDVKALPNLSVNKILGEWYVAYQFDTSNTCLVWNLTKPISELDHLEVTESSQLYALDTLGIDHKHSVTGTIDIPNPEIPSRMRIRWPTSLTGKADFIVFDTDYENYLAVFQCDRAGLFHRRDVTVLSRTPTMDEMFIARIRRLLESAHVKHTSLNEISHHTCRDTTLRDWHIEGELFGLLPPSKPTLDAQLAQNIKNIDLSQIEIVEGGISSVSENMREQKASPRV